MLGVLLAALLVVPTAPSATLVRKGSPIALETAVESSILVCVGTVDQVVRVPLPDDWAGSRFQPPPRELVFGRIRVERVLSGDPNTEFAWHESWSTWACDTTSTMEGKRALFLLGAGEIARQTENARAAVTDQLGAELVLRNLGSGDGILPVTVVDEGVECVHYGGAPSALDLPLPGAFPSRPNARRAGTQALTTIANWIEELARFPERDCVIRMHSRGITDPRGETFDVRFLADGSYRLAINEGRHQTVRSGQIEASAWDDLRAALERASTAAAPLADASATYDQRNLTVRLGGSDRRWSLPANVPDSADFTPELRGARDALISAWTLVRSAIDCADCADHRAADARALTR